MGKNNNRITLTLNSGKYYPPFVSGGGVVFSSDVVRDLLLYFFDVPFKVSEHFNSNFYGICKEKNIQNIFRSNLGNCMLSFIRTSFRMDKCLRIFAFV